MQQQPSGSSCRGIGCRAALLQPAASAAAAPRALLSGAFRCRTPHALHALDPPQVLRYGLRDGRDMLIHHAATLALILVSYGQSRARRRCRRAAAALLPLL